nr:topoisomerase C-terminal repeat-containing protein [Actinomyces trachealis]
MDITAQNGRYGPYLKKGTDSRSLETEEQLFTVTLEQANELFAFWGVVAAADSLDAPTAEPRRHIQPTPGWW